MSYRTVMKGKEYWRLGTSAFLFDLDNPLDVYTLVRLYTAYKLPDSQCDLRRGCFFSFLGIMLRSGRNVCLRGRHC